MWSHQHVSLVISMYRQNPFLYVSKNPLYKNRNARNKALEEMRTELRKLGLDVSVAEIKSKFANLRTNFMAQHRKYMGSLKSGMGSEDIDKPTLWYYDKMQFLQEHSLPRDSEDSISQEMTSYVSPENSVSQTLTGVDGEDNTMEDQVRSGQSSRVEKYSLSSEDEMDLSDTQNTAKRIKIHGNVLVNPTASTSALHVDSLVAPKSNSCPKNTRRVKTKTTEEDIFMSNANDALGKLTDVLGNVDPPQVETSAPKKNDIEIFAAFVGSQLQYLEGDEVILLETQKEITDLIWAARKKCCTNKNVLL